MRSSRFLGILVLCLVGVAFAQPAGGVCRDRLQASARAAGSPPPRIATAVARAAFDALEPAYPVRRGEGSWSDPNATWLQRRGLLPDGWDEETFAPDAWAALLARLQEPYGADPAPVSGGTDAASLVADAAAALARGADRVRPLALVATEPGDRATAAFTAVMWNWTPHPRLLLFDRTGAELEAPGEPGDLLSRLGSCAWRPSAWVTANEDAVADYYFGNVDAGLLLVATDDDPTRREVPRGQERAVLRFEWDGLDGASVAAVEFTGPGPGVGQALGLVSRLRTNLGLFDVQYYLTIPPRR